MKQFGILILVCSLYFSSFAFAETQYTGGQASEAMLAYCRKYVSPNGVSYVLDEYEENNGSAYTMWFHCYTGVTMKLTADLETGEVVESGPYQGTTPHPSLPMSSETVFNLGEKAGGADSGDSAEKETEEAFVIHIDMTEKAETAGESSGNSESSAGSDKSASESGKESSDTSDVPAPEIDLSQPFYLLPDSDKVEITWDMIKDMSIQQWNYARNEIFARHGRKFLSEELMDYFTSQNWYHGVIEPQDFTDDMISSLELKNALFLSGLEYADGVGYELDQPGYDITKVYSKERLSAMKAAADGRNNGGQDVNKANESEQPKRTVSAAEVYREILAGGSREYQNNERRSNLQIASFAVIDLDGNGINELLLTDLQGQTVLICGFDNGQAVNITFDYSYDCQKTVWDEARGLLVFTREYSDQREDHAIIKISGTSSVRGYLTRETDGSGNVTFYVDDQSVGQDEYEKRYNSIFGSSLKGIPFMENTEENRQTLAG